MRSIYFIAALSFLIISCKKETKTTTDVPTSSCICLKENMGVGPINAVQYYGFLTMTSYIDLNRDKSFSYVSTDAFFSSVPDVQVNGDSITTVDSVYLNQQLVPSIKDVNGYHMYYEIDSDTWPSSQEWSIYGAHGIPTFTFSASIKNPVVDFTLVPDNMSKSLVRSFKLNGVTNVTSGFASIYSSGNSGVGVTVILRAGENEICFPEDQLQLVRTGKANLLIEVENATTQTFNGKNFSFSKKIQYIKPINLNP